jgi:hypothetical protein
MTEAKAMKLKEYGTSVINHDLCYSNTIDLPPTPVRMNDTHKSKVLDQMVNEPPPMQRFGTKTAEHVHAVSKDRLL